jgi:hypothetical protein
VPLSKRLAFRLTPAEFERLEQLLDLLRERAQDGNVAAISRLLEIERMRDPRSAAIAALERITKGRES